MPVDLQETRLPGVGTKFTIRLAAGGRLSIIVHNDGKRELYWFARAHDDEPKAVITLDDDESRQLGAVIGGVEAVAAKTSTVPTVLPSVNANLKPVRDFCESI